jgi:hypothetical protein
MRTTSWIAPNASCPGMVGLAVSLWPCICVICLARGRLLRRHNGNGCGDCKDRNSGRDDWLHWKDSC